MKNEENPKPQEIPCALCGASEFTWGNLFIRTTDEQKRKVLFREFGMSYEDNDIPVLVRRCSGCSNVLMFLNDGQPG